MAGLKSRLSGVLAPREREFFEMLEAAGVNAARTTDLLDELVHYYPRHAQLVGEVAEHARRSERLVEELSERLASTFVTPIDPGDLNALSVALGVMLPRAPIRSRNSWPSTWSIGCAPRLGE